jgi:hypothetical protein
LNRSVRIKFDFSLEVTPPTITPPLFRLDFKLVRSLKVSLQLMLRYIYLPHVWVLNNYRDDALGTVEHIF